ncbi:SpoIIE family protein phosphatase [Streptomyces scabiei]|uniref:ATP-binding SpoIIE family protein phosphatase n=1 Tax=Streptomyces scabiei TaxID=1930 RepID=UPI001B30DB4B|nr:MULTISPECIES: SpoIIE family protein phosphatase [Streptomyces]MBP5859654.1 SpoIIE family protein phosphatase [Streptomyces sp. LBUM 1484]MBP5880121.1 SpoIIE family protein phosphatase [Streptomyces sp. LBUM 1477]MBP5887957.1 SpoIIE family protein phosphatase [Streptomyces sp. LBUM 1487]MBP5903968.1 SpoIIE family protein phosphatase [Streptomyces sp. LBUM 1488]MDW8477628.1 SpoIIE family protein phosphatase [Streptomyces scabiei]
MVTKGSGASRAARAGEAMAVLDARGLVAGWSEGARRLTGYAVGDVTGRPAADLVDGDATAVWRALLTDGDTVVDLVHRDGRRRKVALRICPLAGGAGRGRRFVVQATPGPAERGLGELAFTQASMSMSVFDTGQRYLRMNDFACRVMGQPEEEFRHQYFPDTVEDAEHSRGFLRHLEIVVETGQPVRYESWTRSPSGRRMHAWTSEMWPVRDDSGRLIGTALAAFDSSEQFAARQRLALLNEAAGSIGTRLDVVRTAGELAELVVPRLADFASVDLLESVLQGEEPEAIPEGREVRLRRAAHHSPTPGVPEAAIGLGSADVYPPASPPARALLTGEPVLTGTGDHSLDSWFARHGARSARLREAEEHDLSLMAVPLVARGTTLGVAVFVRLLTPEHPDAFDQDDVSLAEELCSRAAVCVDNARRYTRERTTALALQRSLLPKTVAGQAAVEFASRYLPALSQAGVGGDWFDVIPLSGTRVALVVGDVVGHGIHASVTMGRLRTAVWALADVDLPPDELLTHLDDLVEHLAAGDDTGDGEIGATCLYAVYDPVDRSCSIASAGHVPPVVVRPDGGVEVVEVVAGPMLGVGGLPFEATDLALPEGSVLALYTDGLVEARDRDVDTGTRALCAALEGPLDSLERTCDTVLKALLPDTPADDVALLLARTRALDAEQVAVWNLTDDPALVANARKLATDQLTRWGLEEAAFVTELVVSELVTNAIRYGGAPIQLRLIRDRTLICEVSDASSTSPHLRRARSFDEGGRGLLLVAQLTDRWGSRPSGAGKTIWAEQALPPSL